MNIYLIERVDNISYDECAGHIIVANSEKEVVEVSEKEAADEDVLVWRKAKILKIGIYEGKKTEPFVVLTDFKAG